MQKALNMFLVVMFCAVAIVVLEIGLRKQDRIDAASEKAMSKLARDQKGFDLNPDGTIADTTHNQELKRKLTPH